MTQAASLIERLSTNILSVRFLYARPVHLLHFPTTNMNTRSTHVAVCGLWLMAVAVSVAMRACAF